MPSVGSGSLQLYNSIQMYTIEKAPRLTGHPSTVDRGRSRARTGVETKRAPCNIAGCVAGSNRCEELGELRKVDGAHWDVETGAITHMLTEKSRGNAPAILFDNVPDYPKGFRTLYGQLSSARRIALTLGLPLDYERKVDVVQRYHERMQDLKPLPPRFVNDARSSRTWLEGDDVECSKFPVPRHHELDKARFIGTADCVMTHDPDFRLVQSRRLSQPGL